MRVFNLAEELEKERKKNKELKELCNKYEEEHKTVFERWKKDIKIIDELEKYLKEQVFNKVGSSIDLAIEKIKEIQLNAYKYGAEHDVIVCEELLNILQGSDKE